MSRFTGTPAALCATILGSLLGIAATALFLIFGILALVPGPPFDHREMATGIVLVVLSGTGIAAIGGTAVGALLGAALGTPCGLCCGDDNC